MTQRLLQSTRPWFLMTSTLLYTKNSPFGLTVATLIVRNKKSPSKNSEACSSFSCFDSSSLWPPPCRHTPSCTLIDYPGKSQATVTAPITSTISTYRQAYHPTPHRIFGQDPSGASRQKRGQNSQETALPPTPRSTSLAVGASS
ncbi:hypothetical protein Ddc_22753 [Ditylenchus destructor]|nr:hypothetical protein Ddc_22753 [Ditylenchus destructor]